MRQQISSKRFSTMELRPCFSMLAILNGADHQSLRSRLGFFAMVQYTHNLSILIYLAPSVPRSTPAAKVRVTFVYLICAAEARHSLIHVQDDYRGGLIRLAVKPAVTIPPQPSPKLPPLHPPTPHTPPFNQAQT